jgi:hypothetical protein
LFFVDKLMGAKIMLCDPLYSGYVGALRITTRKATTMSFQILERGIRFGTANFQKEQVFKIYRTN